MATHRKERERMKFLIPFPLKWSLEILMESKHLRESIKHNWKTPSFLIHNFFLFLRCTVKKRNQILKQNSERRITALSKMEQYKTETLFFSFLHSLGTILSIKLLKGFRENEQERKGESTPFRNQTKERFSYISISLSRDGIDRGKKFQHHLFSSSFVLYCNFSEVNSKILFSLSRSNELWKAETEWERVAWKLFDGLMEYGNR